MIAQDLDVDVTTVQGWESGRRPLSSMRARALVTIRRRLLGLGAPRTLVRELDAAMDADFLLSVGMTDLPTSASIDRHPLAGWVLNRSVVDMLAWALTGAAPLVVERHGASTSRRGPVARSPVIPTAQQRSFFSHLLRASELAPPGPAGSLLRRQTFYLAGYDTTADTVAWLGKRRTTSSLNIEGWTSTWPDARSVATSLARQGDREALIDFIRRGLTGDRAEAANLNYWAYWLGHVADPQANDGFMIDGSVTWDAVTLLRNFTDRLNPAHDYVDLYIHSIWALLTRRHGTLEADPRLRADLSERVDMLLSTSSISPQARRELDAVRYGIHLI